MPFKNNPDGSTRSTTGNPFQDFISNIYGEIFETWADIAGAPIFGHTSKADKDRFLYMMDEVMGLHDDKEYFGEQQKGSMPGGAGGPTWATQMIENYNPNYGEMPLTGQSNAYDEWYKGG